MRRKNSVDLGNNFQPTKVKNLGLDPTINDELRHYIWEKLKSKIEQHME
jgi:hypothetical protein